jgi:hypothetical protein
MRAAAAAIALASMAVLLPGCADRRAVPPHRHLSIKDDVPKTEPRRESQSAPKREPELSVEERARAEQSSRCGQRHVDYRAGKLNETVDQKRARDEICAELHRYDHLR